MSVFFVCVCMCEFEGMCIIRLHSIYMSHHCILCKTKRKHLSFSVSVWVKISHITPEKNDLRSNDRLNFSLTKKSTHPSSVWHFTLSFLLSLWLFLSSFDSNERNKTKNESVVCSYIDKFLANFQHISMFMCTINMNV